MASLAEWARAAAPGFEVQAQRRDADKTMLDRALEIVRRFIIDRRLILFGGLAVDYALRLRGAQLYPDDERPDFDFLSPRSVDDAYDLADILARAGFANVGVVRAIHVQTCKVRTDFVWVADIGYCPPDVLESIPCLEYQGIRFVHPDYQRMDQHLALCFPYQGAPREDIFNRWKKDTTRFNLYERYYPVEAPGVPAGALSSGPVQARISAGCAAATAEAAWELPVALGGCAMLALLRRLRADRDSGGADRDPLQLRIAEDGLGVTVEGLPPGIPAEGSIVFASPQAKTLLVATEASGSPAEPWECYMDFIPESYHAGAAVALSTRGRLLATHLFPTGDGRFCRGVSVQWLLLWFLYQSHWWRRRARTEADAGADAAAAADAYRRLYCELLRLTEELELLPPVEPLGEKDAAGNWIQNDPAWVIKIATLAQRAHETPPAALSIPADVLAQMEGLPGNYYPKPGKARPPPFDYEAPPLFRRRGVAVKGAPPPETFNPGNSE